MKELITCKDLVIGHEKRRVAGPLNLKIYAGEYLCVIGENGSGKSTFMKTILSLLDPISGTITYHDGFSAKKIGYLPQQTVVQKDFPASVWEVVMSGNAGHLGRRLFYNKEDKMRASANMEKTGITDLSGKCYRDLSGGQQQRALLARALCAADQMILLDEPAAGLDPEAMDFMYEVIAKLHRSGITVVMISHDMTNVEKYADRVVRFKDGGMHLLAVEGKERK